MSEPVPVLEVSDEPEVEPMSMSEPESMERLRDPNMERSWRSYSALIISGAGTSRVMAWAIRVSQRPVA